MLSKPTPVKFRGRIIDWVLFDTPHFPVEERLMAVDLAVKARMYHNINHNKSLKIVSKIYNELTYLFKRKRLRLGM